MSFWKRLFGGGETGPPKPVREEEHKGFLIQAAPYPEAGQFQVAGTISKGVGDERREHRFVRADRFATLDEAAEFAIMKGKQIVDQQGERVFG